MASFNNGSITASVNSLFAANYTGTYTYELLKYNGSTYLRVERATDEYEYSLAFQNPVITTSPSYTFGNPGGFEDNVEGSESWVGLHPGTYKVKITANAVSCPPVEDTIVVGQQDVVPTFECGDTTITIANGIEGDAIPTSAVTATGVSNIIAVYETGTTTPATYINGTAEVDVVFEVPGGYSNTGDSFTCDGISATGTTGGGGGTTTNVYLLHGGNVPNLELPYVVDITTATTYYVNAAFDTDSTANALKNAMTYIIDNQGDQYVPNLVPLDITAINQTQLPNGITFPATSGGENSFSYFIVNRDVISLPLETAQAFSDPANGIPVNWTSFKDFTYNGANWRIYKTEAGTYSDQRTYNCEIA
jgi:hypothetical protein